MPKLGMEPIRRAALVRATIDEIGAKGSLSVTVAQIARRAGVSSALAHHYFGAKDRIFLAAMRHLLTVYGAEVRGALAMARGPRARSEALIRASFAQSNFRPEAVAAWLNFYSLARTDPEAARLLRVYHRRLQSNLRHELAPLVGPRARDAAERIAGLIDGLYLRQGLASGDGATQRRADPDAAEAVRLVLTALDMEIAR
ncbi:choline-binding transcriptional repressor BetI [Pseudoroseicyclus aestuarii]|uniref:HTH-type transcriptional regulator BetI n=1 Tax=Pseudoroseicyclus aestuarii TaxID=1795041 RepID=A0A318SVU1_9RHOB|nr:transcriptional regulator BetI [Pseudoroseicyclus aestuarii]PYE85612.1 TetR family transcriptional regulator [Pseudoroseicyclus aestuarii]